VQNGLAAHIAGVGNQLVWLLLVYQSAFTCTGHPKLLTH